MAKKFRVPVKKMVDGGTVEGVGNAASAGVDAIRRAVQFALDNPGAAAKLLSDKSGFSSAVSSLSEQGPMNSLRKYRSEVGPIIGKIAGKPQPPQFTGQGGSGRVVPVESGISPSPAAPTPQGALSAPGMPIPPQMQRPTPPQQAAMGIGVTPGAINFPGSTTPPAQAPMPYMGPGPEAGLPGLDRASIGMPVEGGGEAALAALNGNLSAPTAPGMTPGMAEMVASAAPQSLMPQKGKDGMDWKKMLMYAGLAGLIGKTGIGTAGAGIMGGLLPLAGALLEKRGKKKTAKKAETKTEAKAKGGQVMAKKSAKKFGGASKAAPKFAKKAAPAMPVSMPPPMAADIPMKCGGKVKRMASGGLVARGMGAATKGGGFKSC
jgi:hypothetical protein